jgi:hypothetical protein
MVSGRASPTMGEHRESRGFDPTKTQLLRRVKSCLDGYTSLRLNAYCE